MRRPLTLIAVAAILKSPGAGIRKAQLLVGAALVSGLVHAWSLGTGIENFDLGEGFIEIAFAALVRSCRADWALQFVNRHHTQCGMADFRAFENWNGEQGRAEGLLHDLPYHRVARIVAVELRAQEPDEIVIDYDSRLRQLPGHLIHHRKKLYGRAEIWRRGCQRHDQ